MRVDLVVRGLARLIERALDARRIPGSNEKGEIGAAGKPDARPDGVPRACDFGISVRTSGPVRLRRCKIKAESHEAQMGISRDLRGWGPLGRLSWYSSSDDLALGKVLEA